MGTPRAATDAAKRVVWRWESDAFGSSAPQQDPDGDGIATLINLRFPGQYYDAESGLHQNWNRTYDPVLGRYISSDPIGLAGVLNTYGYVGQSPLNQVDVNGLNPRVAAGAGVGGLVGGSPGAVVGGVIGALLGGVLLTPYSMRMFRNRKQIARPVIRVKKTNRIVQWHHPIKLLKQELIMNMILKRIM